MFRYMILWVSILGTAISSLGASESNQHVLTQLLAKESVTSDEVKQYLTDDFTSTHRVIHYGRFAIPSEKRSQAVKALCNQLQKITSNSQLKSENIKQMSTQVLLKGFVNRCENIRKELELLDEDKRRPDYQDNVIRFLEDIAGNKDRKIVINNYAQ